MILTFLLNAASYQKPPRPDPMTRLNKHEAAGRADIERQERYKRTELDAFHKTIELDIDLPRTHDGNYLIQDGFAHKTYYLHLTPQGKIDVSQSLYNGSGYYLLEDVGMGRDNLMGGYPLEQAREHLKQFNFIWEANTDGSIASLEAQDIPMTQALVYISITGEPKLFLYHRDSESNENETVDFLSQLKQNPYVNSWVIYHVIDLCACDMLHKKSYQDLVAMEVLQLILIPDKDDPSTLSQKSKDTIVAIKNLVSASKCAEGYGPRFFRGILDGEGDYAQETMKATTSDAVWDEAKKLLDTE